MNAGLLAPLGLLAGISLGVIVLLHMRRQVPATRRVSSLRFWTPANRDDLERSRLRKPPFSWMLVFQLLAAAALTLALARPVTNGLAGAFAGHTDPRHDIVILDGSTSMQAVLDLNGSRTRFDEARSRVTSILDAWQPGDITTLLVIGTSTQTFTAANQPQADALRSRVQKMAVPGGRADINAAFRLAGNLVLPNRENRITLVTDGAVAVDPVIVGAIHAPVTLERVGSGDAANDAITAISSRAAGSGSGTVLVAFTVSHFADNAASVPYSVSADGKEVAADVITLGPNESRQVAVTVPSDAPAVTVSIPQRDVLQADNSATLHLERDALSQLAIMLVADNPGSLQRALEVIPGVRVDVYPGGTPGLAALSAQYDLAVFEGVSPGAGDLPAIPMLFFQPQPIDGAFTIQGALAAPTIDTVDAASPVLADVDLAGVTFGSVPVYTFAKTSGPDAPQQLVGGIGGAAAANAAGTPVAGSAGASGPLLWQGRLNDQPYLAAAFTPDGSNIAQRVAFPILVANAVSTLTVDQIPAALALGDPLTYRPSAGAASIAIDLPNGTSTTVPVPPSAANASDSTARQVTFLATNQTGTYRIRELGTDGSTLRAGAFVVNAGQLQESNLRPNPDLAAALVAGEAQASAAAGDAGRAEIWTLVAALALALILGEWIIALRRAARRAPVRPSDATPAPPRPARAVL